MEIKAKLKKPYTEEQRIEFTVIQNHRNNYELRETDKALEAWGPDANDLLEEKRAEKYAENERVRDEYLAQAVEYKEIEWDSDNEQRLNITLTLQDMSETDKVNWVGADGVTSLECTKQDLENISTLIGKKMTYVWSVRNPELKTKIANAKTVEELIEIQITYEPVSL